MNKKKRKQMQESGKENKTPVMGLLQRKGDAKLTVIGEKTFKEVVRENVAKSAVIISDAHLGYVGLSQEYVGHFSVNHNEGEFRRGLVYTNSVESLFSLFKRTIFGTYHQISPKHLHRYCAESTYRFKSRKIKDADRFRVTISNVEGRLKYKNLIQKEESL